MFPESHDSSDFQWKDFLGILPQKIIIICLTDQPITTSFRRSVPKFPNYKFSDFTILRKMTWSMSIKQNICKEKTFSIPVYIHYNMCRSKFCIREIWCILSDLNMILIRVCKFDKLWPWGLGQMVLRRWFSLLLHGHFVWNWAGQWADTCAINLPLSLWFFPSSKCASGASRIINLKMAIQLFLF